MHETVHAARGGAMIARPRAIRPHVQRSRPMNRTLLSLALGLAAAPAVTHAADASCTVWQRELSFARSVEQHDAAAFASHIEADAVFAANTPRPQRGKEAVLTHWR